MTIAIANISVHYAASGNSSAMPFIFFVGGLALFFSGLIKINRDRLIANMPTSKIRSVALGLVEIYGEVVKHKEALTAPLSGKECVYCRLSITEWTRGRKRSYPHELRAKEKGVLFKIDDGTGQILIDARGANLENLTRRLDINLMDEASISKNILEYCKINEIELFRKNGSRKRIELKETHIPLGQDLYVMGVASRNKYKENNSGSGQEENMVGYQHRQRIFYISDKSEKEILINSVQTTRVMIFGGIVLSVIGLIGIIDNFI
tara:strand:- start:155 stop:946 length:792 start_codon:yes stop_codon:yes gene_type:complete